MPQSCSAPNLLEKGLDDDLDVVTCFKWVTQGSIEVDFVSVLSAIFNHRKVTISRKFMHDPVDSTFTNADQFGDFAQTDFWVFGDTDQNMGVVREKRP